MITKKPSIPKKDKKPTFAEYYKNVPKEKNDTLDYDLEGAYNDLNYKQMKAFSESDAHLPDTYKKPNHITFSNESKYSTDKNKGGVWGYNEKTKQDYFRPSQLNIKNAGGKDKLQEYFIKNEKNVHLDLSGVEEEKTIDELLVNPITEDFNTLERDSPSDVNGITENIEKKPMFDFNKPFDEPLKEITPKINTELPDNLNISSNIARPDFDINNAPDTPIEDVLLEIENDKKAEVLRIKIDRENRTAVQKSYLDSKYADAKENYKYTKDVIKASNYNTLEQRKRLQSKLIQEGYDLGEYGVNKNGIDGRIGKMTNAAINGHNDKERELEEKLNSGKGLFDFSPIPVFKDTPVRTGMQSKEDYQKNILKNYQSYIGSGITTPDVPDGNKKLNCIHGVCNIISNTSEGKKMDYQGNMTFADNRNKEGYLLVNPNTSGFETGDIIQYTMPKFMASRFKGKITNKNGREHIPTHSRLVLEKYTKNGEIWYKVGNNGGTTRFKIEHKSEKELLGKYNRSFGDLSGLLVNRYDPIKATKKSNESAKFNRTIRGDNEYAEQYKNVPDFKGLINIDNEGQKGRANELYDIYRNVYSMIGSGADMAPETLNKLFKEQVGIREMESHQGSNRAAVKALIPDWAVPTARYVSDIFDGEAYTWVNDYWDNNYEDVQSTYGSIGKFRTSLKNNERNNFIEQDYISSSVSKGEFQQKDRSPRGRYYDYDFETIEGQFVNSITLAVDNYHKVKSKYKDLTEDELVSLTTLMHNAPGKALSPTFVNYYLKHNDINYVNSVQTLESELNY